MNSKKMTWEEITKLYDKEWVELIDCDWPEEEINPRSGIVRVHSNDRSNFYKLVAAQPSLDSAIAFVGKAEIPPGVVFSPGMRRVVTEHA